MIRQWVAKKLAQKSGFSTFILDFCFLLVMIFREYIRFKENLFYFLMIVLSFIGCTAESQNNVMRTNGKEMNVAGLDTATFGAGCFWCVEAIYQQLKGVVSVTSGYSGGHVKNPAYREVCNGTTGHAEVCHIVFDPDVISYDELLEVFFLIHDPTTLNRQGNDVGTQYRSVIFYHNEHQKELAEDYKKMVDDMGVYKSPVVTEITQFTAFYMAEDYHQEYYEMNKEAPYCSYTITPKLNKFKKAFKDKIKPIVIEN